jgi:hypothetical protein
MSVRPPARMEQLGSHWAKFDDILYLRLFRKYVEKIQVVLKSDKNDGYFTFSHLWQYVAEFFLEWEMFQIKVPGKIRKHILWSMTFWKSCRLCDNVEKYGGVRGRREYGACAWPTG